MIDLITSIIPPAWLAGLGALIASALALWFGGRKSAKDAAKLEQAQDANKANEVRNEVDNRIARERDARKRLRADWSE